jgi:hypothetical protein
MPRRLLYIQRPIQIAGFSIVFASACDPTKTDIKPTKNDKIRTLTITTSLGVNCTVILFFRRPARPILFSYPLL